MNVYAYYHDVLDPNCPDDLIERWRDSWKNNGFTPHLLQETDAAKVGGVEMLDRVISRLPSVNEKGWERHCWIRWAAYLQFANPTAMFCDLDVINFSLKPEDVSEVKGFLALSSEISPVFVSDSIGVLAVCSMIPGAWSSAILVDGKEHVSDMTMLLQKFEAGMIRVDERCVKVGDGRELTAPCVHFNNGSLPPEWRENNRWKAVDDLIARRGQETSKGLMSQKSEL